MDQSPTSAQAVVSETSSAHRPISVSADAVGAGAGGGTLLAVLAQNLDPSDPLRPWLISLAPAATLMLSAIWVFVRKRVEERLEDRRCADVLRITLGEYE